MDEREQVNPILLQFLDADSSDEQLQILVATPSCDFDNLLIDNMAASIDVIIKEGDIESRIQDLKTCLRTKAKYESLRLRK